MMKSLIPMVFALLVVSSAFAQSEDYTLFGQRTDEFGPKPGAMTFTLLGGAYTHGRGQFLFDLDDKLTKIWTTGLRLGYALTPHVEVEGSFGFTTTQTLLSNQNVYTYFLDGIGQLPIHPHIVPYLVLGFGGVTYDSHAPSVRSSHWGINYGLGIKFFAFKNLAIRPEFRAMTSFERTQTSLFTTLNLTYYAFWNRPQPRASERIVIPKAPPSPEVAPPIEEIQDSAEETEEIIPPDSAQSEESETDSESVDLPEKFPQPDPETSESEEEPVQP